jgi:Tfp pilus assembly protein PilF
MREHEIMNPKRGLALSEPMVERFGLIPALAFWRADRFRELGRSGEALAVLLEAAESHPNEPRLMQEVRSMRAKRLRDQQLARSIQAALDADPKHPSALHDLAVVRHRLGQADVARGLYVQWIQQHPQDDEARLALSRLLGSQGELVPALEQLRIATARPEHSPALDCAEGRLLAFWMDRAAEAREPLTRCLEGGGTLTAVEEALLR